MDELRVRLEKLTRLEKDPIRLSEHKTFARLLYRNRNQHRHGLYFRRLEHVRRLLKVADQHVAWASIRHAVGEPNDKNSRSKTKPPLSLSSVTLDDLQSIESSHHVLVSAAIRKAAVRVTLELISREHFLPFAVAVIATLSRLLVVEQRVLSEIRGAIVETKLLLNHETVARHTSIPNGTTDGISEDVGELVSALSDPVPELEPKRGNAGRPIHPSSSEPNCNAQTTTLKGKSQSPKITKNKSDIASNHSPSLYDLMKQHDAHAAVVAASASRIKATIPNVVEENLQSELNAKSHVSSESKKEEKSNDKTPESVLPTFPHASSGRREAVPINTRQLNDTKRDVEEIQYTRTGDSSAESDDDEDELDDIFDAMGD